MKMKNSFTLESGKKTEERENMGGNTNDFYLCLGREFVIPETISKDYITGRKDNFHCEKNLVSSFFVVVVMYQ